MKDLKNSSSHQQNSALPIILWLLPLIAANLGFYFISQIDYYWRTVEQSSLALQEAESLSLGTDFNYQFARKAEDFRKTFENLTESGITKEQLKRFLTANASHIFRWPFPEHELFVFRIEPETEQTEIILSMTKRHFSRYAFKDVFNYLIACNKNKEFSEAEKNSKEKKLKFLFGRGSSGKVFATSQRGKTTYALYRKTTHRMAWDYFTTSKNITYGYFFLSPCTDQNRSQGMLLALRDFKQRTNGLAAFIPIYKGFGGGVFQEPLNRSNLFRNWVSENVPPADKHLEHWLTKGAPAPIQLGNFKLFSFIGLGSSHLTNVLVRTLKPMDFPQWLFVFNLIFGGIVALTLIRGILFGHWPSIKLKQRFFIIFLLSATLPISLLIISASGYLNQFRQAIHFQTVSNLLSSLKQFDLRKSQLTEDYRNSFQKLVNDPKLAFILKTEGVHSEKLREIIEGYFSKRKPELPLTGYAILNEIAEGIRGYGEGNKNDIDDLLDSFKYPIVEFLRLLMLKNDPDQPLEKYIPPEKLKLPAEAYNSIANVDLVKEIGSRRSMVVTRERSGDTASQLHDYIKIDGKEKFALVISWEDRFLDEQTINQTANYLALNQPDFNFLYYEAAPQGIKSFQDPSRHIASEAKILAGKLAENVFFKGSFSSLKTDKYSLVAYPCQKYTDKIIVGIASSDKINSAIFYRQTLLALIVGLAVLLVAVCSVIITRIIINPITALKSSLDQVRKGNFGTEIKVDTNDEMMVLGNEFKSMTTGLEERNRLAALLSDQAIEALSKNLTNDGILAGESFEAVVLISDIRNFTGLCENHSPDAITDLLNDHFAILTKAIAGEKGRIYKFIGDAVEAVFAADPDEQDKPGVRAFKAACIANHEVEKLNQSRKKNGLFTYRFGIGLAYGKLFSGGVGSIDTRLDYAVLGEAFERAEQLEALSKTNPELPITADCRIKDMLSAEGVVFEPIAEADDAYILKEIPEYDRFLSTTENEDNKSLNLSIDIKEDHKKGSFNVPKWLWKTCSLVFLIAFLLTNYLAFSFRTKTIRKSRQAIQKERVLRTKEQLTSQSAVRTLFGSFGRKLAKRLENGLEIETFNDEHKLLTAKCDSLLEDLKERNINLSRFAGFYFPDNSSLKTGKAQLLYNYGWQDNETRILSAYAIDKLEKNMSFKSPVLSDEERDKLDLDLRNLFGEQITRDKLRTELFGNAIKIDINNKDEFLFTSYLVAYNQKIYDRDLSNNPLLLRNPPASGSYRIVGLILLTAETDKISPEIIAEGCSENGIQVALKDNARHEFFCESFPEEIKKLISSDQEMIDESDGVLETGKLNLNQKEFKYYIFAGTNAKFLSRNSHYFYALVLLIFALFFIKEISCDFITLTKSLAAKLWFSFLLCSILPISTVYFVSELFYMENLNAQISQAKADLQKYMETFELRQSFTEPMAWRYAETMFQSPELKQIVKDVDHSPTDSKDYSAIVDFFNKRHKEVEQFNQRLANFSLNTMALVSKAGWEYINTGYSSEVYKPLKDETQIPTDKKLGFMLAKICKNFLTKLGAKEASDSFDKESVVGEAALQIGLQTVNALFGDTLTLKLLNGFGLPVRMSFLDSVVTLAPIAVPQLYRPDYIMILLILFKNNNYLERIASRLESIYALFPAEGLLLHRYATPEKNPYHLDLVNIKSWVLDANLPISGEISVNDHKFIFQSCNGIHQTTMVMTGLRPINPIIESADNINLVFLVSMLISILLISILAKNVANEILLPVNSLIWGMKEIGAGNLSARIPAERKDELGALCDSFNTMARGLEEKQVMGKMLSSTAKAAATNDYSSHKENVSILYISSPGFSSWFMASKPADLFTDLQKQVAEIIRIILQNDGEIDKIIGEKVLAVFRGKPQEAAFNAVKAAKDLANAEQRGLLPFPVAVGITYGPVIAGSLGVGSKRDFTIIGDSVNTTARIAKQAELMRYCRILISEEVANLLNDKINTRDYGQVELKGKSEPVTVFQIDEL